MRLFNAVNAATLAVAVVPLATSAASAQILSSFDPAGNQPVGIAYGNDEVFVYDDFSAEISVYDRSGNLLRSLTNPGLSSNDYDLDFADAALNVGGTVVPAGSLLVFDGESSGVETLYAIDALTGAELASVGLTVPGQLVGGTYNPLDGNLYVIDWSSDRVRVYDPATGGAELSSFPVAPAGSPAFDVFYGDLDLDGDGNLQIVTDVETFTRVLTTDGTFVQDFALPDPDAGGSFDPTGIAFDNLRGEAWISSRDGFVYQLDGFAVIPEPTTLAGLIGLGGLLSLRRRR